jgi:hypothetical protein
MQWSEADIAAMKMASAGKGKLVFNQLSIPEAGCGEQKTVKRNDKVTYGPITESEVDECFNYLSRLTKIYKLDAVTVLRRFAEKRGLV